MNRRQALGSLAGMAALTAWTHVPGRAQNNSEMTNTQWVQRVLLKMSCITPGMTRADLLRIFTTEGGLSTGLQRTYVSQDCPYFKVDVTFQAVGRPESDREGRVTLVEDGRDRIASISRPYLAFSVMD